MKILEVICRIIDVINEYIGRFTAWVALGLVVLVFITVILRYVFKVSYVWMQELIWYLFSFVFLIGAGYTLLHDAHVRVDIIYQRFGPKGRAWINFLGCIVFLFPGCLLIIITSWKYVSNSFASMEGSLDPGGLPYLFIIKGAIPVGFGLLLMQGVSLFIHSFLQIIGREEASEKGGVG